MGFVVVALIFGMVWLAHRAPAAVGMDASNTGPLGPDRNLPALGFTDVPSPAMTGGTPYIGRQNQLRAQTNSAYVEQPVKAPSVVTPLPDTSLGIMGGLTNAYKSDGGYKRETQPPSVTVNYKPVNGPRVAYFKF